MAKFLILCLLWASSITVQAAAVPLTTRTTGDEPYELHSEYIDHETGERIRLLIQGYSGLPATVEIDSHFIPTAHFESVVHSSHNTSTLEDRDVCRLITDCAGKCADSAATFAIVAAQATAGRCAALANGMSTFLSANNYQEAKSIIANNVVSIAFQFITSPATYYINAALAKRSAGTSSDACGQTQPATYTGDASSAIYQFCLAIQSELQSKVTTRYDAADTKTSTSTSGTGQEGLAKFFISAQKGTFGPVCSDFGVQFKRIFRF